MSAQKWLCLVSVPALLLAVTTIAWSQGQSASAPGQLISSALAAHGAGWQQGNVVTVAIGTQTVYALTSAKGTYSVALYVKGTNKVQRVLNRPPGDEIHEGSNGNRTWKVLGPFTLKDTPEDISTFLESQTNRSLQALFSSLSPALVDLGTSAKGHGVQFTDNNGKTTSYFVDPSTSLITRVEFTVGQTIDLFGRPLAIVEAYVFSDYRNADGLETPFHIQRYRNGILMEELQFSSVSHASSVDDSVFQPSPMKLKGQ